MSVEDGAASTEAPGQDAPAASRFAVALAFASRVQTSVSRLGDKIDVAELRQSVSAAAATVQAVTGNAASKAGAAASAVAAAAKAKAGNAADRVEAGAAAAATGCACC